MRYRVDEKTRVSIPTALFGDVEQTFDKGTHEPKNEDQELALEHLVTLGFATRVAVKADSASTTEAKE